MALDVERWVTAEEVAPLLPSTLASSLQGSRILAIAGHVHQLRSEGKEVANFTIGDFSPAVFRIPEVLQQGIGEQLAAGQTFYPPAVGTLELRRAVRAFYEAALGLRYPAGSVQVGSGARPPIFAAFQAIVDPGDVVVYPVPSWNIRYYVQLNAAEGVPVVTHPEDGFMPTASALLPHLPKARLVVLNSPSNPAGTVIRAELLEEICRAIVAENEARLAAGRRPCMLLYDQVYWQLTFPGHVHHTPPSLVPEMAAYTVMIDAISKCWAATGLRLGWAVAPPPLVARMTPLIGHMGAWAPRPAQLATAQLLEDPSAVAPFMEEFRGALQRSLQQLADGLTALQEEGLPVSCFAPQGAIYLSARFDLRGRTVLNRAIDDDESLRVLLLEEAGVAVVPFSAFGYPDGSGWVRWSVGAVSSEDIAGALERLGALLRSAQ